MSTIWAPRVVAAGHVHSPGAIGDDLRTRAAWGTGTVVYGAEAVVA